jgi:hypothetical protein
MSKEQEKGYYTPFDKVEIDFEFEKIVKPKPKKYGLESCGWVCLVLSGATCFAACNLVMVSLSEHGMRT